ELARLFAQDKYNLLIVARTETDLKKMATEFEEQYGITVMPFAKDLSKREQVFELCAEVKAKNLQVNVLVNDAGQGQYGAFIETDIHLELEILDLNVGAYLILTKHFLKEMVARNEGRILMVS